MAKNAASTTDPIGPIVVILFGDWLAFKAAFDSFFDDYARYVENISDSNSHHLIAGSGDLMNFFTLGTVPDEWKFICNVPFTNLALAKMFLAAPAAQKQKARMHAFTAAISEEVSEGLKSMGYKVINVDKVRLGDSKALFHSFFHEVFGLKPLGV